MKAFALPVVGLTMLVGACAAPGSNPNPNPVGDVIGCTTALFATGSTDPNVLLKAALASPACQGLAADIINAIIGQATAAQQKAMAARALGVR